MPPYFPFMLQTCSGSPPPSYQAPIAMNPPAYVQLPQHACTVYTYQALPYPGVHPSIMAPSTAVTNTATATSAVLNSPPVIATSPIITTSPILTTPPQLTTPSMMKSTPLMPSPHMLTTPTMPTINNQTYGDYYPGVQMQNVGLPAQPVPYSVTMWLVRGQLVQVEGEGHFF